MNNGKYVLEARIGVEPMYKGFAPGVCPDSRHKPANLGLRKSPASNDQAQPSSEGIVSEGWAGDAEHRPRQAPDLDTSRIRR